ncbi:unnamed protein product [Darwinula stevensoni]|uniref:Kringle domain-containing protein n=1 Tax=Darwinula stevensoni TaxID=69355 RepID=A0A7R9A715_9CRUS|nr:unnamed protein product [Darwinula stevensoni]CAG0889785.1 unnamed protein product [Darwinula stevensoni]
MSQRGGEYIGRKNVSHSGFACQPWRSSELPSNFKATIEEYLPGFPDFGEFDEEHNFCRSPDEDIAPWCFIKGRNNFTFEYCDIPFCENQVQVGAEGIVYPECRLTEKGKEYVGTKDVTETGKPCIKWESQPYDVPWDFLSKSDYAGNFLNLDPEIHNNYCRNPSLFRERPWCFVSDPDIKWEYCDIPFCHNVGESLIAS